MLMAEERIFEFFVVRYVPNVVREVFANIGLVMFDPARDGRFSKVRFVSNWQQAARLDPDCDFGALEAFGRELEGVIANPVEREFWLLKFHQSLSNLIQFSDTKFCRAADPEREFELLWKVYTEEPKRLSVATASGVRWIRGRMEDAWRQAGVWDLIEHGVPVSAYTKPGDPFQFDFGYRVGHSLKLFHAVSLKKSSDAALLLAGRYPVILPKMAKRTNAVPLLTAVVDEGWDQADPEIQFARSSLEEAQIRVAAVSEMSGIAEQARKDLGV